MPSLASVFADRVNTKIARLFRKLADPCEFAPNNGAASYTRLVSLDDNGSEIAASSNEYMPELIMRAEFLLSEGDISSGDVFIIDATECRLTQRVSTDSVCVTYVYLQM
ncbi:hypothetical protein [Shewanella polaris]|uniref:Uncharacterized protein n=1 Tax=Shewanella polaris TaxID=2588449 RepID=A0A4Y5YHU5_9GAMM|nr:hypothetical protein [Shewanella polaris]QDE32382.1 hypothetical protein FH971_16275 [Shewanella polaris]